MSSSDTLLGMTRHHGIDCMRFVAFLAVVAIHAMAYPLQGTYGMTPESLISVLSRFAVPFFFITSGYFLARHHKTPWPAILKLAKRLLPHFLCWGLLYLYLFGDPHRTLTRPWELLHFLITGAPSWHLWFLPALGISCGIVLVVHRYAGWKALFIVAAAFYACSLTFGAYHTMHGIVPDPRWHSHYGPFVGVLFVSIGYWLRQHPIRVTRSQAFMLLFTSIIATLTEGIWLDAAEMHPLSKFEYGPSIIVFGLGIFLLAQRLQIHSQTGKAMAWLGTWVLPMYGGHLLFMRLLVQYVQLNHGLMEAILLWALSVLGSIVLVIMIVAITKLLTTESLVRKKS